MDSWITDLRVQLVREAARRIPSGSHLRDKERCLLRVSERAARIAFKTLPGAPWGILLV